MPENNFKQEIVQRIIMSGSTFINGTDEKMRSWLADQILAVTDQEIENRLRKIGVGVTNCKGCDKEIVFIRTKMGNLMPVSLNLISHFADCPGAKKFRKEKTTKATS